MGWGWNGFCSIYCKAEEKNQDGRNFHAVIHFDPINVGRFFHILAPAIATPAIISAFDLYPVFLSQGHAANFPISFFIISKNLQA
jgi:hypothetical protein